MSAPTLAPGTIFDGVYRIEGFLGEGATGEVYRATGPKGGRVALKILHANLSSEHDVVERFRREAAIANQISSPFVVPVRRAKIVKNGRHYIAFELLNGESLQQRLERVGVLGFDEVERLVADVLRGLVAAHAVGCVHRDLKPSNIFLEGSDPWSRARILDFGVSKVAASLAPRTPLTRLGDTLGTLSYMPPEQVRGAATVDHRADLYALGIVLFRCLTGAMPFRPPTTDPEALVVLKLRIEPMTVSERTGQKWPRALETFVERLIARDRDARIASAEAALAEWERACRSARRAGVPVVRVGVDGAYGSTTDVNDRTTITS